MERKKLPSLRIREYEIPYPIVGGAMGVKLSTAPLAAAIAEEGGAGTLTGIALGMSPDVRPREYFEANQTELKRELHEARELSPKGIIGVNLMVAVTDYYQLVQTAVENGAQFIVSGAGLPLELPEYTKNNQSVALIPIVSTLRGVQIMCKKWWRDHSRLPDAFVIETPNTAGGHLGATEPATIGSYELALEKVIPEVVNYLRKDLHTDIPVIAAGGIWDRDDIDQMLALGADGVQMATRFVCTPECNAADEYKQAYIKAREEDIVLISSPVGLPGRAIRNEFVEKLERGEMVMEGRKCFVNCLRRCTHRDTGGSYCIIRALDNAQRGDTDNGLIFAGSNAWRSKEIVPVHKIMQELTQ